MLTYHGEGTVIKSEKREGSETVYNLEVKDLHNFLVGDFGAVVHNSGNCFDIVEKFLTKTPILKELKLGRLYPGQKKHMPSSKKDYQKIKNKYNRDFVCYDDLGFPDFSPFIPIINGVPAIIPIDMLGDHKDSSTGDYGKANKKLSTMLGLENTESFQGKHGYSFPGKDDIQFTWHHHQDGKHMILVPKDMHESVGHSGGAAVAQASKNGNNYKELFPGPNEIGDYLTLCQ